MRQKATTLKSQNGQMLVIAIIFLAVILLLSTSLFSRMAGFLQFGSKSILKEQAVNLAEAGIDYALWSLNENAGTCTGCGTENTLSSGSFNVTIQEKNPPNSQLKTIVSTGYIPNSTNPKTKQTIKTDITTGSSEQGISFRYAIQAGFGGITLSNSARINGTVYSNNNILAGVGSGQIITGDAYAVGNTIEKPPIDVQGTLHPGASPAPMPTIDYLWWETYINQNGGVPTDCVAYPTECNITEIKNVGNKKYEGDLTISNQAVVTVVGPIWVTGNLTVRNGGTEVKLKEDFGSTGTVWIVDGNVSVEQGAAFKPTTANPKGYVLVATRSTNSAAMTISQSGANAVFYALNGGAQLQQTANVSSLVANQLTMQNQAVLNYDTGLASAQFSVGPGGSWQIKKGTYRFTSQ